MGTTSDGSERDVAALYQATYARLVSVVGVVAQDRAEAEEAVQDAFVRLLGQWAKVSRYDDPEAWVRKVAFGFVSKRRRSALRGLRALRRHGVHADVPAPSGDAVDLQRALSLLPHPQREVLVLQDLGLPVADIAEALGVPTGTVKSRLSRARAALAPLLREEAHDRA
jgi:RNA polymerase sigma-70 factor (ECF subfamily)